VRPKAYLETTIVSYLTAWPAREPVTKVHQGITREWWDERRNRFDLFISEIVLDEAARGDQIAAAARLAVLEPFPILRVTEEARELAAAILESTALPPKAAADAMHIAVATVNAMDFLLTWNCTHIANAIVFRTVANVCREMGFEPTTVCTPEELMEG
jgi:predicted nucleic acid-binding protein